MIEVERRQLPDIFLAGAPKSGTTSLFDLLSRHPAIEPSDPKEPFYYIDPGNPHNQIFRRDAKDNYRDFYLNPDADMLHLDGTSQTMYQKETFEWLGTISQVPKFLFVLREPASRILSSFQFTSNNLSATRGMEFNQYVTWLLDRNFDEIAFHCKDKRAAFSLSNELMYSTYLLYLNYWEALIGRENMCIILFENLKKDPTKAINEVSAFLKIEEPTISKELPRTNESAQIKNKGLHYVLHKIYEALGYQIPFKKQILRIYRSMQHQKIVSEDHSADLSRLKTYFEEPNRDLETKYNLDLGLWK